MSEVKNKDLMSLLDTEYLDSYETCRILVDEAVESHDIFWRMIDVCEEHIRGKKPKDAKKLKKAGLSWSNNWNYLKARTKISRVVLENIELVKNSIQMAMPEFKRSGRLKFLSNEDLRGIVSMKLSKVFFEALEKESTFNVWLNSIEYPSTGFGFSAVIFNGDEDWMGSVAHPRDIAFEDRTEPSNVRNFITFKNIKAKDLWSHWVAAKEVNTREVVDEEDEKTDISTTNWSVIGLESVLWNALNGDIKRSQTNSSGVSNWEEVTMSVTSGARTPSYYIRNLNNVRIAKIFYKNLNDSWSEVYIPYDNDWQGQGGSDEVTGDKIIFKKGHGKKHQDQIINLIKDSSFTEGGHIHELRGLAKYSVEDSIRFNRKKNNTEDKLTFSGSPFFEQRNTQQKDAFRITPTSGFIMVKAGFDLLPSQPNFDLTNHLASIEIDEKHFLRETEHFDAKLDGKLTSRPVKDEVQQKAKEVNDVKTSKHAAKMADYSILMLSVLKNLAAVKKPEKDDVGFKGYNYFYEEMEHELADIISEEGEENPKQVIKDIIKSVVSFQIEPALLNPDAIQLAISLAETSYARSRLKRMLLMSQGFPRREIDRIAPLPSDSFRNLRDERVAGIENDMFWTTSNAIIDPEDDHIDHLNAHFEKFKVTVTGIQQQRIDVVDGFKYLANLATHIEGHLTIMEADPVYASQHEPMKEVYDQYVKILSEIQSAAESELKRREEEKGQIPPEKAAELRMLEFEKQEKQRRTEDLTQHKKALTEQKQQFDQEMRLREQQFDQRSRLQEQQFNQRLEAVEAALKQEKTNQ